MTPIEKMAEARRKLNESISILRTIRLEDADADNMFQIRVDGLCSMSAYIAANYDYLDRAARKRAVHA